MNLYIFGCIDANPDLIALYAQYRDSDIITNNQVLTNSAG